MSEFGSSVAEKKRLILKNIDGTFIHCYRAGERDSAVGKLSQGNGNFPSNGNQPENLTISDSELQYLVENHEHFESGSILEQFVFMFRKHQIVFLFLLAIEMSLTVFLLFITWKKRENSILLLQDIYKDLNNNESCIVFYTIYALAMIINMFYYPVAFYALVTKKLKFMKFFSLISLYTGILTIFVVYINVLFLFLFILRLVLYGLSRFLVNLLISILLLPRPNNDQNNNYQTV